MHLLAPCRRSSFSLCAVLILASFARAQITNVTADQAPPIPGVGHDYVHFLNETVNPATGSVSIRIAVPVPPGRGITVPFAFTYDSNAAHHLGGNNAWWDNVGYLARGGWTYLLPRLVNQSQQIQWQMPPSPPYSCTFSNNFVFNDLQGRSHSLGMAVFQVPTQPPGGCTYPNNAPSSISSGGDVYVQSKATTSGSVGYPTYVFPVTVADEDGTVYYFSGFHAHYPPSGEENLPDWIETRNGNKITYTDSSYNGAFSLADTLGRTLLSSSGFGTSGNTITVAGLPNPYTVTWGTATYSTTYASTATEQPPLNYSCHGTGAGSVTLPEISAITLPNGQTYQFQYDPSAGLVSKIIYPTGGYIRYVWGANHSSDIREFYPDTAGNFTCAMIYDTPALQFRYVSFDGSTEVLRQDFSYSTTWVPDNLCGNCQKWTVKTATVVTHDLVRGTSFETDYSYSPADGSIQPYSAPYSVTNNTLGWGPTQPRYFPVEQTVTYKSTAGATLRTTTKGWLDPYKLGCELETLDNGLISGAFYTYGGSAQLTDKKEYDLGLITSTSACQNQSAAPSGITPTRETAITYQTFANTPIFPSGASIFDRPSSTIIYGNGTRVAETDYGYDQTSVSGVSNLPAGTHDETNYGSSYNNRGNATTFTRKCLQSCTDSVTTYTYDETGQTLTTTDACGNSTCGDMAGTNHTTTYSYADNFDFPPSANTNAYVTQITSPPTDLPPQSAHRIIRHQNLLSS